MKIEIALPRVIDHGRGHVLAMLNGRSIRGWSYQNADERRLKMRLAREYVAGWADSLTHADAAALESRRAFLSPGSVVDDKP